MEYTGHKIFPKSKSLVSLRDNNDLGGKVRYRTCSDSSADLCLVHSDEDGEGIPGMDHGLGSGSPVDGDFLANLEKKIEKLSEIVHEQCSMLNALKQEFRNSKAIADEMERTQNKLLLSLLKDIAQGRLAEDTEEGEANNRAKSLLSAIQPKVRSFLENDIRESLVNFLQSDELKEQMIRATTDSVKEVIERCMSRDVCALTSAVLERAHVRHAAHVETLVQRAFNELEERSTKLFKTIYKTSGALRHALERHQDLLEAASNPGDYVIDTIKYTVEEVLQKELSEWREKVANMLKVQLEWQESWPPNEPTATRVQTRVGQPSRKIDEEVSAIDRLMEKAFICKRIEDGEVNDSFSRALSAGDLSLVMMACRCVDPADVFATPCRLQPPVLLSLVQQLATDMLQDTQLKCRYLEEAIKTLKAADQSTRAHLPLVVNQLRSHLNRFLAKYPNHVSRRKIACIVIAAGKLLR